MDAGQPQEPGLLAPETDKQKTEKINKAQNAAASVKEFVEVESRYDALIADFLKDDTKKNILNSYNSKIKNLKQQTEFQKDLEEIIGIFKQNSFDTRTLLPDPEKIDDTNYDANLKNILKADVLSAFDMKFRLLGNLSQAKENKLNAFLKKYGDTLKTTKMLNQRKGDLYQYLDNIFISPVQKCTRYQLTLTEVLKNLPEDDQNYQAVEKFLGKAKNAGTKVNQSLTEVIHIPLSRRLSIGSDKSKNSEDENQNTKSPHMMNIIHNIIRYTDFCLQNSSGRQIKPNNAFNQISNKHKYFCSLSDKDKAAIHSIRKSALVAYFNHATPQIPDLLKRLIGIDPENKADIKSDLLTLRSSSSTMAIQLCNSLCDLFEIDKKHPDYANLLPIDKITLNAPKEPMTPVKNKSKDGKDDKGKGVMLIEDDDDDKSDESDASRSSSSCQTLRKDTETAESDIAKSFKNQLINILEDYNQPGFFPRFYKSFWKPKFLISLKTALSSFNPEGKTTAEIWKWHAVTFKTELEKFNKFPYFLIHGSLKETIDNAIDYLDLVRPRGEIIPLPTAKAILSLEYVDIKNTPPSNENEDHKFYINKDNKTLSVLMANLLRIQDYYNNTLLGIKEIAIEKNIEQNTKRIKWRNELNSLVNQVQKLYLSSDKKNEEKIVLIKQNIKHLSDTIRNDYICNENKSRLANHLAILYNSFENILNNKLEVNEEANTLPKGILESRLNENESIIYINKHNLNHIIELNQQYLNKVDSRLTPTTVTEKIELAIMINQELHTLNDITLLSLNPHEFLDKIRAIYYNQITDIRGDNDFYTKNGDFGKMYQSVQNYLKALEPHKYTDNESNLSVEEFGDRIQL